MAEIHTTLCDRCGKIWEFEDNHKKRNQLSIKRVDMYYGNKSFSPPDEKNYDLCHECTTKVENYIHSVCSFTTKADTNGS